MRLGLFRNRAAQMLSLLSMPVKEPTLSCLTTGQTATSSETNSHLLAVSSLISNENALSYWEAFDLTNFFIKHLKFDVNIAYQLNYWFDLFHTIKYGGRSYEASGRRVRF